MKKTRTHIMLTIKEAKRIMECLETLEAEGGNFEYDNDGDSDESIIEYNKQTKDAGRYSRKLFELLN